MHKGTLLASVLCALFLIGLTVWMVTGPVLIGTYTVIMRHPKTHETVICHASFAPADNAFEAVEACQARCNAFGFERADGRQVSSSFDMSLGHVERLWGKFIPAACKPRDLQRLIREEAAHAQVQH